MLKFDAATTTQLAGVSTKLAWSSLLVAVLGATRRVKCVRHANASTPQSDVFATGVKFRDAALTGSMILKAGIITSYGVTSDLTTSLAADLTTGISVLRIEGGGRWVEGTLGLAGGNTDFIMAANPTATNSIAVLPNFRVAPPLLMASGTGYAPPGLDGNAPAYVKIMDYRVPGTPVEIGRIPFNNRIQNMVFQDAEYATNIGDVRVTQSTESVPFDHMEFGAMLLSVDPQVGNLSGQVLHQVIVNMKPTPANWPNYPRQSGATGGGYIRGSRTVEGRTVPYGISNTFSHPFKAIICKADDTVLHTFEMRDGLPINSPSLSEVPTLTKAMRLHTHCASMLVWNSHEPKLNSFAHKYFPGVDSQYFRPSTSKERSAMNGAYPMLSLSQTDSVNHWYGMPKWAQPCSAAAATADEATRNDPYLWGIGPSSAAYNTWGTPSHATYYNVPLSDYGDLTYGLVLISGWGYEHGSWAGHDQYSGPGGKRIDRACIPGPIAIHMTDPNWVSLRDGSTIVERVKHWNQGYFSHAVHHFEDVKTFRMIPAAEVTTGLWGHGNTYYGGLNVYTTVDRTVPLFAIGASPTTYPEEPHFGAFTDTAYRMPWNGYSVDFFHNYHSPGWAALLYNSPAHAISSKLRYYASIMCQLGNAPPENWYKSFMIRNQAWLFFHEGMAWKLASDHPLGVPRELIEARIIAGLDSIYTNLYVPLYETNSQTMFFKCMRRFGMHVIYSDGTWYPQSFSLHYYMAHALQFWRQSGLWNVMWNKSDRCQKALTALVRCLDKFCFDYYLDTDGAYSGPVYGTGVDMWMGDRNNPSEDVDMPTSWADWQARKTPKVGLEDLVHTADGTIRAPDVGEHSRMQWAFIRRDYFPEIVPERGSTAIADTCAKIAGWQAVWNNRIATMEGNGTPKRSIALVDWQVLPGLGRILPPDVLEP